MSKSAAIEHARQDFLAAFAQEQREQRIIANNHLYRGRQAGEIERGLVAVSLARVEWIKRADERLREIELAEANEPRRRAQTKGE